MECSLQTICATNMLVIDDSIQNNRFNSPDAWKTNSSRIRLKIVSLSTHVFVSFGRNVHLVLRRTSRRSHEMRFRLKLGCVMNYSLSRFGCSGRSVLLPCLLPLPVNPAEKSRRRHRYQCHWYHRSSAEHPFVSRLWSCSFQQ